MKVCPTLTGPTKPTTLLAVGHFGEKESCLLKLAVMYALGLLVT